MAAPSPPRLFAAWRVEAPFFRGFPFRSALQFAFSLTRGVVLHDSACYSKEDSFDECGRPCDTLSFLFFIAPWLRQSQSTLTQEVQQTKDIVGWPVALPAGSDQSSLSSSHEDLHDEHPEDALPAPPHPPWRRDALQPAQIQRSSLDRNTCVRTPDGGLRCVTWSVRGLIGSVTSSQISRELEHN